MTERRTRWKLPKLLSRNTSERSFGRKLKISSEIESEKYLKDNQEFQNYLKDNKMIYECRFPDFLTKSERI